MKILQIDWNLGLKIYCCKVGKDNDDLESMDKNDN